MKQQTGFALLEVVIAVGLTALAAGALVAAISGFARFGAHPASPARSASTMLAEQTLRVAQDVWKYGSPGNAPAGTWQTSIPIAVPSAAPTTVPVTVQSILSPGGTNEAALTVTVTYPPDPAHSDPGSITMTGHLVAKAPLPGAQLPKPGLVPLPSGAP